MNTAVFRESVWLVGQSSRHYLIMCADKTALLHLAGVARLHLATQCLCGCAPKTGFISGYEVLDRVNRCRSYHDLQRLGRVSLYLVQHLGHRFRPNDNLAAVISTSWNKHPVPCYRVWLNLQALPAPERASTLPLAATQLIRCTQNNLI